MVKVHRPSLVVSEEPNPAYLHSSWVREVKRVLRANAEHVAPTLISQFASATKPTRRLPALLLKPSPLMSKRAEPPSDGNTSAPSSNTTVSSTVPSSSSPPTSNTTVSSTAPSSSSPPTSNTTVSSTAPSSSSPPTSNTTVSSTAPSSSSPPTSASPPMSTRASRPPPTITLDAIERAHVTLQARAQAAVANEWSADDEDVVVALDVTAKDVDEVPSEWLGALKLKLRADGVAIITHSTSNAHGGACDAVQQQVAAYAGVNAGLDAVRSPSLPMGRGNAQPDVGLFQLRGNLPPPNDSVAIAVFEVEDKDRTGSEMITTAAEYLAHLPTVECVISVKVFHPRRKPRQGPNDHYVPALAMVFRRGVVQHPAEVRGQGLFRVRITKARSFGNVGVHGKFLESFSGSTVHRLLEQPLSNIEHLKKPLPGFTGPLDKLNLRTSVAHAMEIARLHGRQRLERGDPVDDVAFRVAMPTPLAPLPVDLLHVFEKVIWVGRLDPPPPPPTVRVRPNARANANADGANRPLDAAEPAAPPVVVDHDPGDVLPARGIDDQRVQDEEVVDDAALNAPTPAWLTEYRDEDLQFLLAMMPDGDIDATATNAEGHDDADEDMGDP